MRTLVDLENSYSKAFSVPGTLFTRTRKSLCPKDGTNPRCRKLLGTFFRDKDEQGMLTIIHYPHEKTHEQEC